MALLVIVDDRDVVRVAVLPPKADAPLIVDANTVLPRAITFQLLQAIAGRDAEVLELLCGVYEAELSEQRTLEFGREAADTLALKQALGVPIGEALDHRGNSNAAQP